MLIYKYEQKMSGVAGTKHSLIESIQNFMGSHTTLNVLDMGSSSHDE